MGASKKTRKGSSPGMSPTPIIKGNISKSPELRSKAISENPLKEDTKKSPAGKTDLVPEKKSVPQETPGKKKKSPTLSTPAITPTAAIMSPVRRSGRAPVPSSRFKDMEMGSTSKKRSLVSSQSDESDGEVEIPSKKMKKPSDKSQKSTPTQEENAMSISFEDRGKEKLNTDEVTESKTGQVKKSGEGNVSCLLEALVKSKVEGTKGLKEPKKSAERVKKILTEENKSEDESKSVKEGKRNVDAKKNEEKNVEGGKNIEEEKKNRKEEKIFKGVKKTKGNEKNKEELKSAGEKKNNEENKNKEDKSVEYMKKFEEEKNGNENDVAKADKIDYSSDNCNTTLPVESAVSLVMKAMEEAERNDVEESGTFESTPRVSTEMDLEMTVHTYMDEEDVIMVDASAKSPSSTAENTEDENNAPSSDIITKSQRVILEEKDGQTVAIIKVPSTSGNNQSISSAVDKSEALDISTEESSTVVTKTSPVNKNRHGYILNKPVDEPSIITLAGQDGNKVMNVSIDPATVRSVLKPKTDTTTKATAKTYGRVLKQESPLNAMVIKSRHTSQSEPHVGSSNIIIQSVGTNQSYSLLPQAIKAVSQTEGKTYSLLAPPSELKQMLKEAKDKPATHGNKSTNSVQLPEVSSTSQKVIIIAHPSGSDGSLETSTAVTVSSVTTDAATLISDVGTEQNQMGSVLQVAENTESLTTTTLDNKEFAATVEVQTEDEKLIEKEMPNEMTHDNLTLNSDENLDNSAHFVIDISSDNKIKLGAEISCSDNDISESASDKHAEELSQGSETVNDSKKEKASGKNEVVVVSATETDDENKPGLIESSNERLLVEEVEVSSSEPTPVIKIENSEEGFLSPSMNVLSTALAEAEKQNSGSLKPQRIKLIENGIVYELQIFPEGEGKASQEGKEEDDEEEGVSIKQEVTIEEEVPASDQDVKKFSSGTQTFYSSKRGRPKTADEGDDSEAPVHKLATIVQEGDQKKHYYYVSVVPGKTIVGKYRHSVDPSLPGCIVNKLGEYCCKECEYKTDKKANFYKHRRLHTGAKPHICPFCKYQARTSSNLKRHMGIHDDIREFKCTQCTMSFRQKIHLERHVRYRHEEKRVKCPMCDYVCANEQPDLKMHIKRKHTQESGKTFSCPECKLVVGSRRDLKQHLKFHKDGPELKLFCKECSFVTDCKSRLQRHLVVHSNVKPFHCGVCDYKATQKEHVLRHLRSQHKIEVNKPKRPWKKQIKSDAPDNIQGNTRGDFTCGDKIFACNHCIMRFAKLINLYKHLHTQHSDIMPLETEGNYYCVVCEFSTTSKKNLLVHMRRHNMTDQTPPTHVYSCVLCRYVNPRRRNLFQHMRKKHNIDISSQVDIAGMKEEEVNAVQEGVKVIQTEEGIFSQRMARRELNNATVETNEGTTTQVVEGDLAAVANMIKIEDLTRTQVAENEDGDDHSLVIDNTAAGEGSVQMIHTTSLMQHKAADAIEGLQALAAQAGFIIEEEVQGTEKQTIVIEQPDGEVLNTTLPDGSIVISTDQDIVEEQIAIDETSTEQIVESEEVMEVGSGLTSLELTEEQLSSLQNGDMIQIEGQVYLVELTQDPDSPDKQLLSFLPVNQA